MLSTRIVLPCILLKFIPVIIKEKKCRRAKRAKLLRLAVWNVIVTAADIGEHAHGTVDATYEEGGNTVISDKYT